MSRIKSETKDNLLIPDDETAKILGISPTKLYDVCNFFDSDPDDEWELNEGEHFEWLNKGVRRRRFYETGAMAIAKYLQEKALSNIITGFLDLVREKLTNRRKKVRQQLVKRRIINEFTELGE